MVFKCLQFRLHAQFNENVLPYKIFYSGSTYSESYNSYNFCDRSKLFAALNLPVNCL